MVFCGLLPIGIAIGLLVTTPETVVPSDYRITFFICLGTFIAADLMAGDPRHGLSSGYLNLAVTVAWLALGLLAGLWVLILGVAAVSALNLWRHRQQRGTAIPWRGFMVMGASRLSISGNALLVSYTLYQLMDGQLPLLAVTWEDAVRLSTALLAGLLTAYALSAFFREEGRPLNKEQIRRNFLLDASLLIIAPTMSVVLYNTGVVVFGILSVLTSTQALRYRQITQTRESLDQRVQELSTLSSVGRMVATNFEMEYVLQTIYKEIKRLVDFDVFAVALYNPDQRLIDCRLVMDGEQRSQWPLRHIDQSIGLIRYPIHSKTVLHITADEEERFKALGIDRAETDYTAYLGVPLLMGQKCIGVIAIMRKTEAEPFSPHAVEVLETIANQTALAIRNVTLYERTTKIANNLSLVNKSVQNVMFNLDSDEAMRAACETAMDIASATMAAIYLLDTEKPNTLRLEQSVGLSQPYKADATSLTYDPHWYQAGSRILTRDTAAPGAEERFASGSFHTITEIPLRSGNTLVGNLLLCHQDPYYYDTAELELLETLTYQITAALDNAELLKALELYASEQAQLVHLSRISTASLHLDAVAAGVSTILRQMMAVQRANIGLLIRGKERIRFLGEDGQPDSQWANVALKTLPEIAAAVEASSSTPLMLHRDDATLSDAIRQMMIAYDDAITIVVPMTANKETLGVLLLGHPEARAFTDGEWRLLEMATNQVATQVHNAQLYTETENALNRQLEQLSLIETVAQQITSALDHEDLIKNVMEAALRATQADMAALALLNEHNEFQIIGQEVIDGVWYEYEATQPKDEGLIGHVARTGKTELVSYNPDAPYYSSSLPEGVYLSALAVPLLKDEKVIGVLNVESVQPDFFTEEQASFLNNLAGHAVISIENGRLLQEREYQIQTLTSLRQLSLRLSSAQNKNEVIHNVLRTAITLLQGNGAIFMEFDSKTNDVTAINSIKIENGQPYTSRVMIPQGITDHVILTGESEIIEDVSVHIAYQDFPLMDYVDYASLIVVPIKRGPLVREILCVTFVTPHTFRDRDLSTIELLTIQIAAHVENASLLERIRAGNTRMRAILDASRDGVIFLDRDGNLRDINTSAERLLGVSLDEHIGENFAQMLMQQTNFGTGHPLTDMARILRLEPERITRREFEINTKGQPIYIEEVASPVTDPNSNIIGRLLVFRDITEERELAIYREEITHMAVHDLRNPLSSIISSLTLALELIRQPGEMPLEDTLTTVLDVSLDSANSLLALVESMLDIAKLERREMTLNRTITPISLPAQEAARQLAASAKEADIDLVLDIPEDLNAVYVDKELIRRVFINLIGNAIKFTPTGTQILVTAAQSSRPDQLIVRVADSGRGVPPEERERIFDKFRQVAGVKPERGGKGTGLGLTFCKVTIETHGGRIWVEPESPLPGACFAFTLPSATEEVIEEISTSDTVSNLP